MAIIDNKEMIDEMIRKQGNLYNDPNELVYMIVEYTNAYGKITWGVTWNNNSDREKYLRETEYVRNPKIL